jgi:hypothetical protein
LTDPTRSPQVFITLSVGQRIGLLEILAIGDPKATCLCHGCGVTIFRPVTSLKEAVKRFMHSSCKKCRPKVPLGGVRFGSGVRR